MSASDLVSSDSVTISSLPGVSSFTCIWVPPSGRLSRLPWLAFSIVSCTANHSEAIGTLIRTNAYKKQEKMAASRAAVHPAGECLLLQWRPLANESVFFIIHHDDGSIDCWRGFWRPVTLIFNLFNLKLALHLLVPWETFMRFWLFYVFCFWVTSRARMRQTDGQHA